MDRAGGKGRPATGGVPNCFAGEFMAASPSLDDDF
jgi:hypothetical protein